MMQTLEKSEAVPSGATQRGPGDERLLERFVAQRDEAAFAAIVQRYGSSVWGVCRRLLAREQDAEDAFQATFFILARKAGSIRKGEAIGSWLYGVAHRTAMKARQNASRRDKYEKQAPTPAPVAAPWGEAAYRELQRMLDEEVQRLAAKLRGPFVLCCLQGLTKAEAARALGWKEGTVSGRLAQARELLRSRLARRGVSLSAVLTVIALTHQTAAAAVPTALVQTSIQSALAAKAGSTAVLSPSASILAKGVLQGMAATKLFSGATALLAVALLAAGAGVAALQQAEPNGAVEVPGGAMPALEAENFLAPAIPLFRTLDEQVLAVALSPDGSRLVTAGGRFEKPGQLKIWDVASTRETTSVPGIPGVRTVAYSPDGTTIATGDVTGTIRLRDAKTVAEIRAAHAHDMGVNGLAFSRDGQWLATAGLDARVKLWDARTLKERKVFLGHKGMVFSVAFFHDGHAIVTCGKDRTAKIWDVQTGSEKFTLKGHQDGIEMVAIAPDDKLVATASWDCTVRIWDAQTGVEKAVWQPSKQAVFAVAFLQDGKRLACATGDGMIHLCNLATQQAAGSLRGHASVVWALAVSADGKTLASGSSDKTARLWDLATSKEVATLNTAAPSAGPVSALARTFDGSRVAVAVRDDVHLRDGRTGVLQHVLRGHTGAVSSLAFAADGKTLASGSLDATIRLWDPVTGKERQTIRGHAGGVAALAYSGDGQTLASGGDDRTVRLWDAASGEERALFKGHTGSIHALAFVPGDKLLASGSADRTIKVWDPRQPEAVITLQGHTGPVRALALAVQGKTLASGGDDQTIKLWDLSTKTERLSLPGHAGAVHALAFAPSGGTLVSGGDDAAVLVWDTASGEQRQALREHQGAVNALAMNADGEDVLSGGADGAVLRWRGARSGPTPITLQGDPAGNRFAAFSPVGDRLATGGSGGTVTLWAHSLAPAQMLQQRRGGAYLSVAFAPDGRTVALANHDRLRIADAFTAEVWRTLPMGDETHALAYSPDGKYLAGGTGRWESMNLPAEARLFDARTGEQLARLPHPGMVLRVCFAPDGKTLATSANDKLIRLWDLPSGELRATLQGHKRPAKAMTFLPDGTLVSGAFDRTIRFWDVRTGKETRMWKVTMTVRTLDVSPDGALLAASEGVWESKGPSRIEVWEVATGKVRLHPEGHDCRIQYVTFTRDGKGLLAAGGRAAQFGEVNYWDLASSQLRATQRTPNQWIENIGVSLDGRRVMTASSAGLNLWDLSYVRPERQWAAQAGALSCGVFLPDGQTLATGGADGTVRLWSVATGDPLATLSGHKGPVTALALLPGGTTLVSASEDTTVKRWDLGTKKEIDTLSGHTLGVLALAVSPDGRSLATAGGNAGAPGSGEAMVWDLATGKQRDVLPGIGGAVRSLAYCSDSKRLVGNLASGVTRIWEVGQNTKLLDLPVARGGCLAVAPNGAFLAVGQGEASAGRPAASDTLVWDTTSWHKVAALHGHRQPIASVAFAPDGWTMATASGDGTIKLWPTPRSAHNANALAVASNRPAGAMNAKQFPVAAAVRVPVAGATEIATNVADEEQPQPRSKVWLVLVEVLALLLTLAAVGAWLFARRRAQRAPSVEKPQAARAPVPGSITFDCRHCGKKLRTRADQVGKKVKCPQCAAAVLVPRTNHSTPSAS